MYRLSRSEQSPTCCAVVVALVADVDPAAPAAEDATVSHLDRQWTFVAAPLLHEHADVYPREWASYSQLLEVQHLFDGPVVAHSTAAAVAVAVAASAFVDAAAFLARTQHKTPRHSGRYLSLKAQYSYVLYLGTAPQKKLAEQVVRVALKVMMLKVQLLVWVRKFPFAAAVTDL